MRPLVPHPVGPAGETTLEPDEELVPDTRAPADPWRSSRLAHLRPGLSTAVLARAGVLWGGHRRSPRPE